MPHALVKEITLPTFPFEEDGYHYKYSANCGDERLVLVEYLDISFFLKIKSRAHDIYVGFDKNTRPSPVGMVKSALTIFLSRLKTDIIASNLAPNTLRQKEISPYLKNIDFFVQNKEMHNLWIEIGFGSGRHLLYQAYQNPSKQFIGIEIHKPSIEQILRRIKLMKLTNILILSYDARLFMELLDSNSVERIFLHFPVPWDKKPHRRVLSATFLDEAKRILACDGNFELRTDSDSYFECAKGLFEDENSNCLEFFENRDLEISSKYEERWKKQNKTIYDLIYTQKTQSEPKMSRVEFDFDKPSFSNIKQFENKTYKEKDFFVHFERVFFDEGILLIRASFGDFGRPEQKYIEIDGQNIKYIFGNPVPTSSNLKAHNFIKGMLCGR